MLGPILLPWVLLATVSTMQCRGTDCHPTRTSHAIVGPHRLATFDSPAACALYREKMAHLHQPVVRQSARPDVTVRKTMTFTCTPKDDPL